LLVTLPTLNPEAAGFYINKCQTAKPISAFFTYNCLIYDTQKLTYYCLMLFKLPEHVLMTELDGEAVLLDLEKSHYFGLNEIGTDIIHLMQSMDSAEKIVDDIHARYDVERNTLQSDYDRLITELLDEGLIVKPN